MEKKYINFRLISRSPVQTAKMEIVDVLFVQDAEPVLRQWSRRIPVTTQLLETKAHIERKYHAHKFIAYFQNYTNTFLPVEQFLRFLREAASVPDIVEIAVSTRPDCIREDYLEALLSVKKEYHVNISIELGLQTVNYHTLREIGRGHTLANFWMPFCRLKNMALRSVLM